MNSNMTFNKHTTEIRKKIRQLRGRLYPLLNRNSQINLQNKLTIIKMIIIPTIIYGSEVWSTAKPTRKKNCKEN